MEWTLYDYPRWTTARKAKAWLDNKNIPYKTRHIIDENPSAQEVKVLHEKSGLDIKNLMNTSGVKYKELGLKDKVDTMGMDELYELLATDGMLVKRPILTNGQKVLVGFKEQDWEGNVI